MACGPARPWLSYDLGCGMQPNCNTTSMTRCRELHAKSFQATNNLEQITTSKSAIKTPPSSRTNATSGWCATAGNSSRGAAKWSTSASWSR
eukprot:6560599-Prymnesium_polylepis.1